MKTSAATNDRRGDPPSGKINPEFSKRLARLKPGDKLRAVVLLGSPAPTWKSSGVRLTREERLAAIGNVSSSASAPLREIDEILARFDGRGLSEQPSAMLAA